MILMLLDVMVYFIIALRSSKVVHYNWSKMTVIGNTSRVVQYEEDESLKWLFEYYCLLPLLRRENSICTPNARKETNTWVLRPLSDN